MEQYEVSGKPTILMPGEKPVVCSQCKNGEIFENRIFLKVDVAESDYAEPICGGCNTKYRIKKQPVEILISEGYKPSNPEYLTRDSAVALIEEVGELMEEERMNHAEDLEKYQKTGVCTHPHISLSNKVKTAEGEFVFKSCVTCKEATVDYKGKTYKGKLNELVNWVAQNGIKADKELAVVFEDIDSLGLKGVGDVSEISFFDDTEELNFL